jgi:hypothetical protein
MDDFQAFVDEIIGSSFRLRMVRGTAAKVVAAAVLTRSDLWRCQQSEDHAKRILRRRILMTCNEYKVGNPLIFIAILGIIINLIWQWWLHRQETNAVGAAEESWDRWFSSARADLTGR